MQKFVYTIMRLWQEHKEKEQIYERVREQLLEVIKSDSALNKLLSNNEVSQAVGLESPVIENEGSKEAEVSIEPIKEEILNVEKEE